MPPKSTIPKEKKSLVFKPIVESKQTTKSGSKSGSGSGATFSSETSKQTAEEQKINILSKISQLVPANVTNEETLEQELQELKDQYDFYAKQLTKNISEQRKNEYKRQMEQLFKQIGYLENELQLLKAKTKLKQQNETLQQQIRAKDEELKKRELDKENTEKYGNARQPQYFNDLNIIFKILNKFTEKYDLSRVDDIDPEKLIPIIESEEFKNELPEHLQRLDEMSDLILTRVPGDFYAHGDNMDDYTYQRLSNIADNIAEFDIEPETLAYIKIAEIGTSQIPLEQIIQRNGRFTYIPEEKQKKAIEQINTIIDYIYNNWDDFKSENARQYKDKTTDFSTYLVSYEKMKQQIESGKIPAVVELEGKSLLNYLGVPALNRNQIRSIFKQIIDAAGNRDSKSQYNVIERIQEILNIPFGKSQTQTNVQELEINNPLQMEESKSDPELIRIYQKAVANLDSLNNPERDYLRGTIQAAIDRGRQVGAGINDPNGMIDNLRSFYGIVVKPEHNITVMYQKLALDKRGPNSLNRSLISPRVSAYGNNGGAGYNNNSEDIQQQILDQVDLGGLQQIALQNPGLRAQIPQGRVVPPQYPEFNQQLNAVLNRVERSARYIGADPQIIERIRQIGPNLRMRQEQANANARQAEQVFQQQEQNEMQIRSQDAPEVLPLVPNQNDIIDYRDASEQQRIDSLIVTVENPGYKDLLQIMAQQSQLTPEQQRLYINANSDVGPLEVNLLAFSNFMQQYQQAQGGQPGDESSSSSSQVSRAESETYSQRQMREEMQQRDRQREAKRRQREERKQAAGQGFAGGFHGAEDLILNPNIPGMGEPSQQQINEFLRYLNQGRERAYSDGDMLNPQVNLRLPLSSLNQNPFGAQFNQWLNANLRNNAPRQNPPPRGRGSNIRGGQQPRISGGVVLPNVQISVGNLIKYLYQSAKFISEISGPIQSVILNTYQKQTKVYQAPLEKKETNTFKVRPGAMYKIRTCD